MNQPLRAPEPLGRYAVGRDPLEFAKGASAGNLIFLNGLLPDLSALDTDSTLLGTTRATEEATSLWRQAAALLDSGDSGVDRIVRADQFFPDWRAVPFFHQLRRQHCPVSAPSTSLLATGLAQPDASMSMDLIAATNQAGPIETLYPDKLDIPATSAFAPVAKVGGWVFVAGFMAAHGPGDLDGIADSAKVPEGHLWKGNRIQLETEYLIRNKLIPALAAAGLSLRHVKKATIGLSDLDDLPAMNQVWVNAFEGCPPATTIIPTANPGFAITDARIEINLIAHEGEPTMGLPPPADCLGAYGPGYPAAVRIGDFLAFSGAVAVQNGQAVGAAQSRQSGHRTSLVEEQAAWLIELFAALCEAHGTSLRHVVRISQIHTDMRDFLPACRAWQRALPGIALPIAGMQAPRLPVDNAVVQAEIWVYAP
ncbi:RidA family protein [Pusillimonas sp. SM2304]|uniref:RidA family protein n=1 Tax=Pusillimonas sp. SM2304 TaxID=3073241 RepID=UPI002875ACEF|nr:RidA family protein [Pusillimonas sp. SM2304]MDS1142016.1 RidA family protein [Pusillimonas sp. SM2304]